MTMPEEEKKEKKEEPKKEEAKKEEPKKEEPKKDEGKIIMEARIHCEACRYKVYKAIIGYPGVEDISIDMKTQKVTLKAPKVDAKKLFETVKKKSSGKIVKLIYPDPNAPKKDNKSEEKKDEKKKEEKKPVDVTVVLKVYMHCGACTKKVEKACWKNGAVYSVKVEGEKVIVKGTDLDPKKVCEEVMRRSGKYAEVVPPKKEPEKKDGKDGGKGEEKKEGGDEKKKDGGEKKEGGEEKKKDGGEKKEEGEKKKEGDKKEGGEEKKKDGGDKEGVKKEEKQTVKYIVEYVPVYAPQYFSDENPNACSIM